MKLMVSKQPKSNLVSRELEQLIKREPMRFRKTNAVINAVQNQHLAYFAYTYASYI